VTSFIEISPLSAETLRHANVRHAN